MPSAGSGVGFGMLAWLINQPFIRIPGLVPDSGDSVRVREVLQSSIWSIVGEPFRL